MVATPTVADVRSVISTTLSDEQVDLMIQDAVLIVSKCPAVLKANSDRQKAIVKWVAAHLISQRTPEAQVTQRSLGDASETFARATLGVGLAGTFYGQQAILLDPSGCLERLGRQRAFVRVL